MTELKKIKKELERRGRVAYKKAKSDNNAYIVIGNSIYKMSADGSKEKVETIPTTRVKVTQKKYVL